MDLPGTWVLGHGTPRIGMADLGSWTLDLGSANKKLETRNSNNGVNHETHHFGYS